MNFGRSWLGFVFYYLKIKNASDQKIEMETLREETLIENEKLAKRKKEIDAELEEIEPLIKEGAHFIYFWSFWATFERMFEFYFFNYCS